MLTFNTGSVCDVCAEEYGPQRRPHSIACGHVFCGACCTAIVEKTSPRLVPACPFCREPFAADSIRPVRVDFSHPSTPRRPLSSLEANDPPLPPEETIVYGRPAVSNAKMLEEEVAKVAQKKCSVQEVRALHDTLRDWLSQNKSGADQTPSLHLSAALLRAILLNHLAHTEANRAAKQTEAALRAQLDDIAMSKAKLEVEVSTLRAELGRLKNQSPPASHPYPRPLSSASSAASATSLHQQLLQSHFRLPSSTSHTHTAPSRLRTPKPPLPPKPTGMLDPAKPTPSPAPAPLLPPPKHSLLTPTKLAAKPPPSPTPTPTPHERWIPPGARGYGVARSSTLAGVAGR